MVSTFLSVGGIDFPFVQDIRASSFMTIYYYFYYYYILFSFDTLYQLSCLCIALALTFLSTAISLFLILFAVLFLVVLVRTFFF